jgi:hypothetical protein
VSNPEKRDRGTKQPEIFNPMTVVRGHSKIDDSIENNRSGFKAFSSWCIIYSPEMTFARRTFAAPFSMFILNKRKNEYLEVFVTPAHQKESSTAYFVWSMMTMLMLTREARIIKKPQAVRETRGALMEIQSKTKPTMLLMSQGRI